MGAHIVGGLFQSDKYPTTPPGKVPLSVTDPTAQDLLWEYAQRRRAVDVEFADDLEWALKGAGFEAPARHSAGAGAGYTELMQRLDERAKRSVTARCKTCCDSGQFTGPCPTCHGEPT